MGSDSIILPMSVKFLLIVHRVSGTAPRSYVEDKCNERGKGLSREDTT